MATLTMTAKRQATFPKENCDALSLKPGDVIELESRDKGGIRVWVLPPPPTRKSAWIGCLRSQAKKAAAHSLSAVRESSAGGRKGAA